MKLFLAPVLLAMVAAPLNGEQPRPGDIFENKPGSKFRSWDHVGGGLGVLDQPYAVFERGGTTMIAVTTPVVRGPRGGIEVEKIVATKIVRSTPGEETLDGFDCPFLTLIPTIAFYNPKSGVARGYFAIGKEVVEKRWIAARDECQYGGD